MRKLVLAGLLVFLPCAFAIAQRDAAPAPAPTSIPDVYVQAGNSFVITVPNLTRVAVGNPLAVTANVVSPTEVLIQGYVPVDAVSDQTRFISSLFGNVTSTGPDGSVTSITPGTGATPSLVAPEIRTSEVFVWSGQKRYVYRVVVIHASGDALPYGISRMVVEPNKVIFYGLDVNRAVTEGDLAKFRALGLKYELRLSPITPSDVVRNFAGLDSRAIEAAVRQGRILPGMTLDDVERSRGPVPQLFSTELRDSIYVDIYRYPDYDILVYDGTVLSIDRRGVPERTTQDQVLVRAAIDSGIVIQGMTLDEVIQALGPPPTAPVVVIRDGVIRTEYTYPTMRVVFEGLAGNTQLVARTISSTPAIVPSDRPGPVALPTTIIGGDTKIGRAFELRYLTGADIIRVLDGLNERAEEAGDEPPFDYEIVYSSVEGKFMIYSTQNTLTFIESLISYMDRPRSPEPIQIEEATYIIPGNLAAGGLRPDLPAALLMARFGSSISAAQRDVIIEELRRAVNALPVIPNSVPFSIQAEGSLLTLTGAPEQVRVIRNVLADMIPATVTADIARGIKEGVLIEGMTKPQVEAALGVRLDTVPLRTYENGALLHSFDIGDRLIVLRSDILLREHRYPAADQRRDALERKRLIPFLHRNDVEAILGEAPRRLTSQPDGTVAAEYDFGTGIFYNDRLLRMNFSSGAEAARRGITVAVEFEAGREFDLLTTEEKVSVFKSGSVMTGMTERDVARILGESPYAIRPGATPNIKTYVFTDYEITFIDGIATDVRPTGTNAPRIIALKSRSADDIAAMIRTNYSEVDGLLISTDSISNRLIIKAPAERYAEIERFAKAMDQQNVSQVLIEAKFVEVSRTAVKQLGIDWGLSTVGNNGINRPFAGFGGSQTPNTGLAPDARVISGSTGASQSNLTGDAGLLMGIIGGNGFNFSGLRYANVDIIINALESRGDADVLSSPRILTLNNTNAILRNEDVVYNITTTTTTSGNPPTTVSGTEITEIPVGITLDVTPTIGQDGMITMALNATVSRVNGEPILFGNARVNPISTRTSNSRVQVRSGTPLVIGGLSTRTASRSNAKIPGLGSLPFIGKLFQSQRGSTNDIDLLIFLTARIIPADGTVAAVDELITAPRPEIPNPVVNTALPGPATAATPAR